MTENFQRNPGQDLLWTTGHLVSPFPPSISGDPFCRLQPTTDSPLAFLPISGFSTDSLATGKRHWHSHGWQINGSFPFLPRSSPLRFCDTSLATSSSLTPPATMRNQLLHPSQPAAPVSRSPFYQTLTLNEAFLSGSAFWGNHSQTKYMFVSRLIKYWLANS